MSDTPIPQTGATTIEELLGEIHDLNGQIDEARATANQDEVFLTAEQRTNLAYAEAEHHGVQYSPQSSADDSDDHDRADRRLPAPFTTRRHPGFHYAVSGQIKPFDYGPPPRITPHLDQHITLYTAIMPHDLTGTVLHQLNILKEQLDFLQASLGDLPHTCQRY
ncbi:hypothetical protein JZU46_04980 [bacterium]|nr:hypothetical protein [bacterium]